MSVWILRTEPWVDGHPLLKHDLWKTVVELDGVAALDDAEVISLHTLEEFLLPAEESLVKPRTSRRRKVTNDQP